MDKYDIFNLGRDKNLKCRICRDCDGVACRGEIPGLGGKGSGDSFIRNRKAVKRVRLKMNVLTMNTSINTDCYIFDEKMSLPLFVAPISNVRGNYGIDMDDKEFNTYIVEACKEMNIISFVGDGKDIEKSFKECVDVVDSNDGYGIVTMKPWTKNGIDIRCDYLKDKNYKMLAMDVDSCGLALVEDDIYGTENKDKDSLSELIDKTGKKLIVKGVMDVPGALVALKANASGIIVSNHGGRVLDDAMSSFEVLSEIANAVRGRMSILVDGGIRSGNDIYKALALGADAVLIGRPLALAAIANGKQGIKDLISIYHKELLDAMKMTGCHRLSDIRRENVTVSNF